MSDTLLGFVTSQERRPEWTPILLTEVGMTSRGDRG
jgi:hypothetical protein